MRLLVILLLALGVAARAQGADIILAADEWCPYNCDPASERPGFVVEIAREVFAASGRGVDYRLVNWPRSIADVRAGRIDGILCAVPREAPDLVYPLEPVGMASTGIAVRQESDFHLDATLPFDGKVIGAKAGYEYVGATGAYVREHNGDRDRIQLLTGDNALDLNLRKLAAGRVDAVVDDVNVLPAAIERQGLTGQLRVTSDPARKPVYIAFSPARPDGVELARLFDEGILRLRASGRLAAILSRYKIHDWR